MQRILEKIDLIKKYDSEIKNLYDRQLEILDKYISVLNSFKKNIKLEDENIYLISYFDKEKIEFYLKNKFNDSDTILYFYPINKKSNLNLLQKGIEIPVANLRTSIGDKNFYHTLTIKKENNDYKLIVVSQVNSVEVPNQSYRDSTIKEYIMFKEDVELLLNNIKINNFSL